MLLFAAASTKRSSPSGSWTSRWCCSLLHLFAVAACLASITVASAFQLTPSTTPEKIIEEQLAALKEGDMEGVYRFASPGNKAQTGGNVENFSKMVRSGPYRYLVGHFRSDILLESKMAASRQYLVRVTAPALTKASGFDDDEDYDGERNTKNTEKIMEYWWSLSRCNSGEYRGSYMVDAVIPNQM